MTRSLVTTAVRFSLTACYCLPYCLDAGDVSRSTIDAFVSHRQSLRSYECKIVLHYAGSPGKRDPISDEEILTYELASDLGYNADGINSTTVIHATTGASRSRTLAFAASLRRERG